ncbi:hypothetical protein ATEIFO6365_0013029000 [Aspergillus terreus]|uniref:Uncharacterized protein n=1 Tax=Aspergillus terreus TaxID=33178 RepID=A0A5M3ZGH7_ASPTE|nr:hypothetical protein ATETN484_0014029000 [Aspergillus terreus]GFF20956.1 hypothetical protein ATEIFO6365_0013029000 [Aspergillus terreus]
MVVTEPAGAAVGAVAGPAAPTSSLPRQPPTLRPAPPALLPPRTRAVSPMPQSPTLVPPLPPSPISAPAPVGPTQQDQAPATSAPTGGLFAFGQIIVPIRGHAPENDVDMSKYSTLGLGQQNTN